MEIKAELKKPYSKQQRLDFVVEYNHNQNLQISEDEMRLIAFKRELSDEDKITIIKIKLNEIDLKSIRALRCGEQERLNSLENEAIQLREELNKLLKGENYEH